MHLGLRGVDRRECAAGPTPYQMRCTGTAPRCTSREDMVDEFLVRGVAFDSKSPTAFLRLSGPDALRTLRVP